MKAKDVDPSGDFERAYAEVAGSPVEAAGPADPAGLVERLTAFQNRLAHVRNVSDMMLVREAIAALSRAPEAVTESAIDAALEAWSKETGAYNPWSRGYWPEDKAAARKGLRAALLATPPAPQPALALIEEDEVDLGWIQTATVLCERLGIEPKADAHHIVCGIEKLKAAQPAAEGWVREAGVDEILSGYSKFINERPMLMSLLYDIDMLPEQCKTRAGAIRLAGLCEVWKKGEAGTLPASPNGIASQEKGGGK